MELAEGIVFPLSGHNHSQCLLIAQVMWWENDTQKIPRNPSARFDCTNARDEYHGQWLSRGRPSSSGAQLS
jgi:hypothetical protein